MEKGTCGKNLTWQLDDNGTLTISGTGDMNNYGWIFGKSPWRKHWKSLKKVVIDNGVTNIGEEAFRNCERLAEVSISDSVTSIQSFAFDNCTSLTEIKIPNSVKTINSYAFDFCWRLTKVFLPENITTIGARAFAYCKSLKEIEIPSSVTSIGTEVFYTCDSLKKIHYKPGIGFEKNLLDGNKAQLVPYTNTSPTANQTVSKAVQSSDQSSDKTKVQAVAENLRWKLEGRTLTVGGVLEIKDYSHENPPWFKKRHDIFKIVIEEGVEKISTNAFNECIRLEELILPLSVKTIGDFAFTFCYCGDKKYNGGKNVIWSLEDGVLLIKKNPAAKNETNFSTGYEIWNVAEKNIKSVRIERGVTPSKRFYDWLNKI